MQFSDTTNKDGIIQDCESILFGDNYGQITDDANLLATFTRNSNRALDRATSLIFDADGRWDWDDKNRTDYPIAVTDLVSGQSDYRFNVSHLKIDQIEIRNESDSTWRKLKSINRTDFSKPLSEVYGKGAPIVYTKIADAFFLYPEPNYSVTNGLKVYFQRAASYFEATDTTKEPGFAKLYHRLISLWASYDYASVNGMPIARVLRDEILVMEQELQNFYSFRSSDEHITLKARQGNFR
jgi:hypothetical protein